MLLLTEVVLMDEVARSIPQGQVSEFQCSLHESLMSGQSQMFPLHQIFSHTMQDTAVGIWFAYIMDMLLRPILHLVQGWPYWVVVPSTQRRYTQTEKFSARFAYYGYKTVFIQKVQKILKTLQNLNFMIKSYLNMLGITPKEILVQSF